MNRIERRIRNLVNPYSTAFAGWWCHSARYLPLVRVIAGTKAVPRPPGRTGRPAGHIPAATMAARRAAIDAVLAGREGQNPDPRP